VSSVRPVPKVLRVPQVLTVLPVQPVPKVLRALPVRMARPVPMESLVRTALTERPPT
jgi:hypothetical protein